MSDGLSEAELHRVDAAARRIHSALRDALALFPEDARSASALSRHLNIDRTTCQRAVFAAMRAYPGPQLIAALPGARALQQLMSAAESNGIVRDDLTPLRAAVEQLESTVNAVAGSVSRLIRRIDATATGAPQNAATHAVGARARLFDAAAELTGRSSACWFAIYAYWPADHAPGSRLNLARMNGLLGHTARADAVPLTFANFSGGGADEPAVGDGPLVPNADGSPVIGEFSTQPAPVVSSRRPGVFVVQAVDTDPSSSKGPIDIVMGSRSMIPHPASRTPPIDEAWAMVNFPVRTLIFDIYLHRDLARLCIPSVDQHLWRPDFAATIGDRWQTRFPDSPPLEVLGPALRAAAPDASPRHNDYTKFLFDRASIDPRSFVGYRCLLEYPIWRTGCCVSFDYGSEPAADS